MNPEDKAFKNLFDKDNRSSIEALDRAQFIAFAPYVWEASKLLMELGILEKIDEAGKKGISQEELSKNVDFPPYGLRILLEASLGLELTFLKDNHYCLAKTGYFLLHNEMTRVNFDFIKDVCEPGIGTIKSSVENDKPMGLKALGPWPTVYEGLSQLEPQVQKSWLAFDHFYSDRSFDEILNILTTYEFDAIIDIGGNTGKWTKAILNIAPDKKVGFVDLPGQIDMAKKQLAEKSYFNQINWYPQNILQEKNELPEGYDAIWMSQFLDCFSDDQIVQILTKCHEVINEEGYVFINETFWDRQQFKTSAFSLQMTSFYFTSMANGNSQMYDSKVFFKLIENAGFEIKAIHDLLGHSHTLLVLQKKS